MLIGALAAIQGCDRRPEHLESGLVHGCAARPANHCAVDQSIDVWLSGAAPYTWQGARITAQAAVADGLRYTLEIDPSVEQIEARRSTKAAHHVFRLPVVAHAPVAAIDAARAAIKARRFDDARARLAALSETPMHAGPVASLRARLLQRQGQARTAAAAFEAAAQTNAATGRPMAAADDTIVAAFLYVERLGLLGDARRVLAGLQSGPYIAAEVRKQFFLGRAATLGGDLRAALRHLRVAYDLGRKIGLDAQSIFGKLGIAQALHHLGRTPEALDHLAEVLAQPDALSPCVHALLLTNAGWFRHTAAERKRRVDPQAVATLQAALDTYVRDCNRPAEITPVRINLVLACLAAGNAECATRQRAALHAGVVEPAFVPWLHDVDGRLALAQGQPEAALARYTALAQDDIAALTPDLLWRADVGRAEALIALGRAAEARTALEAAEVQLDADLGGVPLHEGRESFAADHERSARMLVEVLLRLDQPRAAFNAARRARARVLGALQTAARLSDTPPRTRARHDAALSAYRRTRAALMDDVARDATRSASALTAARIARRTQSTAARAQLDAAFADVRARWRPTPRPADRLSVLYHPTADGWVGFTARGSHVVARRLSAWRSDDAPARLSAALLQPFAEALRGARHIEFMPFGATRDLDLHALPVDGQPLAASAAISYALDLPSGPPPPARGAAFIIADPRGDLPAARREADVIAPILSRTLTVQQLRGPAATPAALRAAAEQAEVLHYAGHGVFKGVHGWESVLPLADGLSVGVGDILALRKAPRLVVLSGCETGRSARGAAEGLGLGQAFVAAGAREVIAAVRPVPDADASLLITAMHTARAGGQATDEALQTAQRMLRRSKPDADWAAFRMLRP